MSVLHVSPLKAPREGNQISFQRNAPTIIRAGPRSLAPKEPNAEIQPRSIAATSGRNYGCTIERCGVLQGGHARLHVCRALYRVPIPSLPGDVGYWPMAAIIVIRLERKLSG